MAHSPSAHTQSAADTAVVSGHTPGLWKKRGLSRVERVKAYRVEFGVELAPALLVVDAEIERQRIDGKARLYEAAPDLLETAQGLLALVLLKYGNLDPDVNAFVAECQASIRKATTAPSPALGGDEVAASDGVNPNTPAPSALGGENV